MATLESLGLTNASTLTGLALGVVASYAVGGPAKGSFARAVVFGAIGAAAGRMLLPQRPLSPQERLALAEREEEKARQQAIINRQEAARRRTEAAKKAAMAPAVAVQRARMNRELRKAKETLDRTQDILDDQKAAKAAERAAQFARDKAAAKSATDAQYADYTLATLGEDDEDDSSSARARADALADLPDTSGFQYVGQIYF